MLLSPYTFAIHSKNINFVTATKKDESPEQGIDPWSLFLPLARSRNRTTEI
jgi:hypothetical protein